MIDLSPFKNHITKRVQLTDAELTEFISFFTPALIKKRQFVVQPNFVARHRNYVIHGAFRGYVVGNEGEEHSIQFAIDDWWISDYNSYVYQQPATMFVVAVEDSLVMQIEYDKEAQLKAQHHKYETFFRIMAERSTAFMQRRLITNLTKTAEERFDEFEEKYHLIARRMPQYAIASYLGMTSEYFSKLRNKRLSKKS